jgi:hypothetical protein
VRHEGSGTGKAATAQLHGDLLVFDDEAKPPLQDDEVEPVQGGGIDTGEGGQGFAVGDDVRAVERQRPEAEAAGETDLRPLPAMDRAFPPRAMFGNLW